MSILEDFLKKTGKPLACPLCGKDDLLLPPAGVNQFRVVCRNCGHFMWFDTSAGLEVDERESET